MATSGSTWSFPSNTLLLWTLVTPFKSLFMADMVLFSLRVFVVVVLNLKGIYDGSMLVCNTVTWTHINVKLYWFILNSIWTELLDYFNLSYLANVICWCIHSAKDCYRCPSFKFTDAVDLLILRLYCVMNYKKIYFSIFNLGFSKSAVGYRRFICMFYCFEISGFFWALF